MRRKVVKQGPATLMISLPSSWVKQNSVNKGDELELTESDRSLILTRLGHQKEKREMVINIDSKKDFMQRILCGPYIKGYTSMKVYYKDPEVYECIQNTLRVLIGFEIVEQGKDFVNLEEITPVSDEKLINLIHRMFNIIKSFVQDAKSYIKDPYKNIDSIYDIERTCNKLTLYCARLLNSNINGLKTYELTAFYHLIWLIEMSSDEIMKIINHVHKNKLKIKNQKLDNSFDLLIDIMNLTQKKITNYFDKTNFKMQMAISHEQRILEYKFKSEEEKFIGLDRDVYFVYTKLLIICVCFTHMSQELFF